MMVPLSEVIDDMITAISPENVSLDYIILAKYTDKTGIEKVVQGSALEHFMSHPQKYNIIEARVVLDIKKIRLVMWSTISDFFIEVHERVDVIYDELDSL